MGINSKLEMTSHYSGSPDVPARREKMMILWSKGIPTSQPKNMKHCWEVHDEHMQCMDKFDDVYENHHKCPASYKKWQDGCSDFVRWNQMSNRQVNRTNN